MEIKVICREVADFAAKLAFFFFVYWMVCWPGRKWYLLHFDPPSIGDEIFFPLLAIATHFVMRLALMLAFYRRSD